MIKNILLQDFYATKFKIQIKVNCQKTIGTFRKLSYDSGGLTVTKENETVAPNDSTQTQGTKSCSYIQDSSLPKSSRMRSWDEK